MKGVSWMIESSVKLYASDNDPDERDHYTKALGLEADMPLLSRRHR